MNMRPLELKQRQRHTFLNPFLQARICTGSNKDYNSVELTRY